MKIVYSPKFAKEYKKLPDKIKDLAEKQERYFRINPFDSRLHTHKLTGKFKGFCAFSVDYKYRIIFEFADKGLVFFLSIGDHDIYK